jgi:metallopeptidase MepB
MMAKRGAPSAWWRCLVPALIFASLGSAAAIKRDDVTFPDPPQKLPVMKLTADDLNKIADDFEASQKDLLARITNVSLDDANFNNTFQVYAEDAANAQLAWSRIEGLELWAAAAELQAAANAANDRITQMGQLLLKDERVYARFEKVYKKFELDDQLGSVEGRIVRRYYDAAKDSAANSPTSPERGRVAAIDQECTDLQRQFTQNIQDENTTLWYTLQELDGVDQSTLDGLSKGEGANAGKFGVPAKNAYGLTYTVKNETVRQNMVIAQNNLFPQNVDIIKKSVVLRDEEARLLNYSNWAAEVLGDGDRLAKSTEDVSDFLKNLQDKLSPVARIFGQNLVNENKKDNPSATLPFVWNNGYYGNKISQERFKTNSTFHINEYFPAEHTLSEILDMYSDMFGFMFQPLHGDCLDRLSPTGNGSDLVWHEDVKIYAVWDEPTSQGQPPEFVGFIYVDMYGRENKVPGSWNQPLEPGWSVPNGERHYPTTGVVANLKKAAADSDIPTLLGANDVSILLHELVHAMHHISCQVQFGVQCGPSYAPTEFVELPSQMLQVSRSSCFMGHAC